MYEMQIIAIDDLVAWAYVIATRVTVLAHSQDGAASMRLLLHYCSRLFLI